MCITNVNKIKVINYYTVVSDVQLRRFISKRTSRDRGEGKSKSKIASKNLNIKLPFLFVLSPFSFIAKSIYFSSNLIVQQ